MLKASKYNASCDYCGTSMKVNPSRLRNSVFHFCCKEHGAYFNQKHSPKECNFNHFREPYRRHKYLRRYY